MAPYVRLDVVSVGRARFLNENQAREVLLIRAIESGDAESSALSPSDRERASHEARRHASGVSKPVPNGGQALGWSEATEEFVSRRAGLLIAVLTRRYPALRSVSHLGQGLGWRAAMLPIAALILGLASNELGGGRRINIIFFPLLGLLLWNIAVYALLVFQLLRRPAATTPADSGAGHPLHRLVGAVGPALPSSLRVAIAKQNAALGAGIERYAGDLLLCGAPLHGARAALILHLSAALFAVGAVAGMYAGGLGLEYLAGWESTFLDETALAKLLAVVLGPASMLTGIALPEPAHLATLHWSTTQSGENAAPWIHLYAVTAALFIVLPRGLLAMQAWRRAYRLRTTFPLPNATEPYFRRLLAAVHGEAGVVRIVTYSYHLSDAARDGLRELLSEVLGERMKVEFSDAIAYGAEDDYLAAARRTQAPPADSLVIVFNLAATPEAEIHGILMHGLHELVQQGQTAHRLVTVLDESAYRQRLAGEAGAEARLAQRRAAWEDVLHTNELVAIDLASADRTAARAVLESVFANACVTECTT